MAITDHDTVDGVAEGARAAAEAGVRFLPGLEISVRGGRELHILGYCVDCGNPELLRANAEFSRQRRLREERIYAFLEAKGAPLSREQVRRFVTGAVVGRAHFARALVEANYASDFREAFEKYLATPDFYEIERPKPSPEAGIGVIRGAGGVAALAHPALLRLVPEALDALIGELAGIGLEALECHYSANTRAETELHLSLAEKYGLLITGGSDFHGERVKRGVAVGTGINASLDFRDEAIDQKLMERAARNRSASGTKGPPPRAAAGRTQG
jgi:predicted metal-dependent phosphoesterase TrpH